MQAIGKLFEGRFQPRRPKNRRQRPLRQETSTEELPPRTETFPAQLPPRPATSHTQLPLRLAIQFAHLFMITTFLSLTIPRLVIPGGPHYLYTAIGVFISAESLGLLAHELLTENVRALQSRGSERVYMLLNVRGLLMWAAAAFVTFQGDMMLPDGPNIVLGKLALGAAIIVCVTTICLTVCYFQGGTVPKQPEIPLGSMPSEIELQAPSASAPEPSIHLGVPDQSAGLDDPFTSVKSQSCDIASHWSHWSGTTRHGDREHNDDEDLREYQLDAQSSKV
ncbi:hypothetical protein BKA59DRAFT_524114 [Fusarium tricinctum]|uniref:Uncharacterized protein n=1 Tax=Fusarium tricinctum TaxID=61284 RepID=A0A8K0RZ75_9HYPO|nr:hypothetical protein BKA59DRAFT_524114 [Fusarium tricinctum]